MKFPWFDIVVAAVLIVGLFRGRKRGMSLELLSVFQVLVVVVAGAEVYRPLGDKLAEAANGTITRLLSYVIVYVAFIIVVHMIFSRLRRAVGEKLVGSDIFGSMEYYFGMVAGIIRYAALTIIFLALMHAKAIDYKAAEDYRKAQLKELGSSFFPSFTEIQIEIFDNSYTGKFVAKHLQHLLIEGPKTEVKPAKSKETIRKKTEREMDEVLGTPKTNK